MSDLSMLDSPANDGGLAEGWGIHRTNPGISGIEPARSPRARGAAMSLRLGDQVPGTPYVVLRCIGQGGMGEVYEVQHLTAGLHGALKVLHPKHRDRADLVARMWREARVLAAVEHPGVVQLLDLGETADGRPFLVMELLDGHDLREVLASMGPMPVDDALLTIAEALDALEAIHAAGIVHRDIKLENLFLCRGGGIKVIDFGVAKACWAETSPTVPGFTPGTPRTMAPEQCALLGVDPRADLYAAGLSLYELCVGRGPFDDLRNHPQALRFAHCTRRPPSPAEIASQPIPPEVEEAILRALSKSPGDRFQSAGEMAAALRRLVRREPVPTETTPDAPPPAPRRGGAPTRRGMTIVPELLCALLLVGFVLGLLLGRALADPRPPRSSSLAGDFARPSAIRCKRPRTAALFWANEDGRT